MAVGVVYSEINNAAESVAGAIEPLQATLSALAETLEAASPGFRGQAAAGYGEAVNAWFDKAIKLGPILEGYAQHLVGFAGDHQTNDRAQAESYGRLGERLGGVSAR